MVFKKTENSKNKNTPVIQNKIFVFFVFNNKKQLTGTKQTLIFPKGTGFSIGDNK